MPGDSSIEWTDRSWNPVTGCSKVSPGCAHCYAETFAERWRGIPGHAYEQGFDLRFWPERLELPLRWRKPRMIFVNSMSDLFHEDIPFAFIDQVFDTMRRADHHVFQVLTKRAERLLGYTLARESRGLQPLPNVWLGVSVENRRFVSRARLLRTAPAAVRFISAEPLLGPLVHDGLLGTPRDIAHHHHSVRRCWLDGYEGAELDLTGIDWLIAGGESGPRCRPMREEWVRGLREACEQAGTAFFVKQMGTVWARANGQKGKGGDLAGFPKDLRVRQMPVPVLAG